ncbi:MAG: DUF4493 domain-containing protein [Bacteroidales bacterium]|nr:DUF4493 domain-containing protein [Bacteroidales bacterium]
MKVFLFLPLVATTLLACDRIVSSPDPEPGTLSISFVDASSKGAEIPDTNSFILSIRDDGDGPVWTGLFADAPKELSLPSGEYTVEAVSRAFTGPVFDSPQYGDRQTVEILPGRISAVHLSCAMLNSAVRLQFSEQFVADYPGGNLYVKSAEGTLMYSYGEKRTGYFYPGTIWVLFNRNGTSQTLATRELAPREVLVLRIGSGSSVKDVDAVAERYGDGISIEVDTTHTWTCENYYYGNPGDGGSNEDLSGAYSVGQARSKAAGGEKGVWVYGYIAGGDLTSKSCSFSAPFKSNTNLVLAPDNNTASRESCLAVQLSQGDIRDALNLVDHPELLGKLVYLKGNLVEKYYGMPGLQGLSGFRLQ